MTATDFPTPKPLKRVAILGTAPSHVLTPWHDETLEKWGLNDAYMLGFPTAHRWYDLHLFHQMTFRPKGDKVVRADQVPVGSYVRPADHLDWLRSRPFPVYLQEQRPDWPTARVFPREQILDTFAAYWPWRLTRRGEIRPGKDYESSSPAWMLMHAIVEGYAEIHVYGIHLATEWEYVEQRPNFEFLIGRVLGSGKTTETVTGGLRRYESQDGIIVLPEASPILASPFRYAVDVRPRTQLDPLQWDAHRFGIKRERAVTALKTAKWWQRKGPLQRDVWHWDGLLVDTQEQIGRFQAQQQMGAV